MPSQLQPHWSFCSTHSLTSFSVDPNGQSSELLAMFLPVRVEASLSILPIAPFLTTLPIAIASRISLFSAPAFCASATAVLRQGWQFAVTEAPTAISSLVLFSMLGHLFCLCLAFLQASWFA